jgi:peptidyl-prolyl cis-trans isomerase C
MRERQQELEDRKVELLAYDRGLAMDARGLAVLAAQVQSLSGRGLQLDPAARQTPLFTYKRGAITVGTYLEALYARRIKNTQALLDSSFVSAIVRWFILPDRLFMEAAEEEGLVQESEFLRWEKRTKEELLLKTLQQRQVSEQVSLDEEEVRRYVQENPDNFLTPKEICFDELVVPNEEKASRIKAEIPPTADLIEVARRYKLPVRPRRPDGLVCMTIQTKTLYPHLWEALDTAPIGALGGPVPTHEGYALFRVVRRQDPQPEPYEQARKRARSALQQRAEQVRFNAWMAQLREKYQDRIAIYPDRLEQALPEAMLASVTRPPGEQN